MNTFRNVGLAIIAIGAVTALGIMTSAGSATEDAAGLAVMIGFCIWITLPFALMALLTFLVYRKPLPVAPRLVILFTSFAITTASLWIYWTSMYRSTSSTSALVFLFIPFYSLIAIVVLFGAAWLRLKLELK